jgi:hypothetical protein
MLYKNAIVIYDYENKEIKIKETYHHDDNNDEGSSNTKWIIIGVCAGGGLIIIISIVVLIFIYFYIERRKSARNAYKPLQGPTYPAVNETLESTDDGNAFPPENQYMSPNGNEPNYLPSNDPTYPPTYNNPGDNAQMGQFTNDQFVNQPSTENSMNPPPTDAYSYM